MPKQFPDHVVYVSTLGHEYRDLRDPTIFSDAMSRSDKLEWQAAIQDELKSIEANGTWELVDRPVHEKVIDSKWVFKIKASEGKEPKYKARLVARGFRQEPGVHFQETFAPVVRKETLRLLFALAVKYDLDIFHLDVKTAFLNGDLKETIFMTARRNYSSWK